MISKHIDLLAIGGLLLAMALFTNARQAAVLSRVGHVGRFVGMRSQNPIVVVPHISRPACPRLPSFSMVRD